MVKKDNIAVFGGTFNPVHNGHIKLLKTVSGAMDFKKFLIVPSALPPHKRAHNLASGEDRAEMCRMAFKDFPRAEICGYEINRGGKNYTADTLTYLKSVYPDAQLHFLMGTDMLLSFNTWREPERILKNASLICIRRDDSVGEDELKAFAKNKLGLNDENFKIIKAQPVVISSTEIREMLLNGADVTGFVPRAVAEYIKEKGLYAK